jgi:hypothetical protein
VYRSDHTLFKVCYGDFGIFCNENNLSVKPLSKSYQNGGEPIFQNASNNTLVQLKKYSREFQVGWYAIKEA